MEAVSRFVALCVVVVLYAAYFRLAGRMLRTSGVAWISALQFSAVVVILSLGGRMLANYVGSESVLLPAIALGFLTHVFLGAWFFRERTLGSDGRPIGWGGGAMLAAIAFAFLFLTSAVLVGVMRALLSLAAP